MESMRWDRRECFWLNRGAFTKFQSARQQLLDKKEKTEKDEKLEKDIEIILEDYHAGSGNDVLRKLGGFLSTPLDEYTLQPLESNTRTATAENAVNMTLNVVLTLLRLFTFV